LQDCAGSFGASQSWPAAVLLHIAATSQASVCHRPGGWWTFPALSAHDVQIDVLEDSCLLRVQILILNKNEYTKKIVTSTHCNEKVKYYGI
jgi:hypothetical protein